MKFEVVKKLSDNQTIYKLPCRVDSFTKIPSIAEVLLDLDVLKFAEGYELAEDISKGIEMVCVSDANTHAERLVFPAFMTRNLKTGEISPSFRTTQIGGSLTFRTHGGDLESIREHEVYLRAIMQHHYKETNSLTIVEGDKQEFAP
jgi:hypothetical protein